MNRPNVGSLRFRLSAVATVVVAVVLTVASVALLRVQRRQLTINMDNQLQQEANDVVADLRPGEPIELINANPEDRAIQIVAADGTVLAATDNLAGDPALPNPLTGSATQATRTRNDLPLEDDSYRVLSRRIQVGDDAAILHVAENSDDLNDTIRLLTAALGLALPALIAVLGALMWWLTGRTLDPVERIRSEVDAITTTNSTQRIHVPNRHDEISRLATTMNNMLERLNDATARQQQFVADAAHELRTPLTRIRTNVEVDLAQPGAADPKATNLTIRDEAIGLQHLIDDLLHLARSDAGHAGAPRTEVDLDDIVMQEIQLQRAAHPGVKIDARQVSGAHVHGNPEQLSRAVRNLLSNAVRHANSVISVALSERGASAQLSVADDGPGVPTEHRQRIFERFARVHDARTRDDGGVGLGLAITKDIVDAHGGSITYDDDHTNGACFVVSLPLEQTEL
ncbi:MAG: HAMP domain-containing protein [Acidimicrobiales bacterium]|nr:HAMP domain-containing protein [Acidimicrobiales bacterium]